jgi:hypothetical protein
MLLLLLLLTLRMRAILTSDSFSLNHLHSTMNTDTAAATANWIMTTLRLAVGSNTVPVMPNQAMRIKMTQPLTKFPIPCKTESENMFVVRQRMRLFVAGQESQGGTAVDSVARALYV